MCRKPPHPQPFKFPPHEETPAPLHVNIHLDPKDPPHHLPPLEHQVITLQDVVEIVGSDMFMEMLNKLNPFHKEDPATELECAVAVFDVENGLLSSKKNLVVETKKMKIIGDGKIALVPEDLDITFSPSARQGVGGRRRHVPGPGRRTATGTRRVGPPAAGLGARRAPRPGCAQPAWARSSGSW